MGKEEAGEQKPTNPRKVPEYPGKTKSMKVPSDLHKMLTEMAEDEGWNDCYVFSLFNHLCRDQIEEDYAAYLEWRKPKDAQFIQQIKKRNQG